MLFLFKNKKDELFTMSLFLILKCEFLIKTYREYYLEILFKNFVEKFHISDDN